MSATYGNTSTNTTHLLWADRWIEACRVWHPFDEFAWRFKTGKDAADWLLYPQAANGEDPQADGERGA